MANLKKSRIKPSGYPCQELTIGKSNLSDSQPMAMTWQRRRLTLSLLTQGLHSSSSIQISTTQSFSNTSRHLNVSRTLKVTLFATVMAHGLNSPLCSLELRCIFQGQLIRYKQMKDFAKLVYKLYQLSVKLFLGIPSSEGTPSHLTGQVSRLDFMAQLHLCISLIRNILFWFSTLCVGLVLCLHSLELDSGSMEGQLWRRDSNTIWGLSYKDIDWFIQKKLQT